MANSQGGNNNTYCQDNATAWVDWQGADADLLAFTRTLTRLRAQHPVFRRRRFFTGDPAANGLPDIAWLASDGTAMGEDDWSLPNVQPLGVFLNGHGIAEPGPRGEPIADDSFLVLFNPTYEDASLTLPPAQFGEIWEIALDTGNAEAEGTRAAGSQHGLGARSLVVLRHA